MITQIIHKNIRYGLLSICRPFMVAIFVLIGLLGCPASVWAQLDNGSFEANGQPSLEGWSFACSHDSVQDTPQGGGEWSLLLTSGSTQGCFPGTAEQPVDEVQSGEVWKAQVWVKNVSQTSVRAGSSLYWKVVSSDGEARMLPADTSSSTNWKLLTVVDTLEVVEGDEVRLVLDAGLLGGPLISWSHFDLAEIEKVGEVSTHVYGQEIPQEFVSVNVFPNPVRSKATIRIQLAQTAEIKLSMYDVLGREVATLATGVRSAGIHDVEWVPENLLEGMYLLRMQAGEHAEVRPFIVLHD